MSEDTEKKTQWRKDSADDTKLHPNTVRKLGNMPPTATSIMVQGKPFRQVMLKDQKEFFTSKSKYILTHGGWRARKTTTLMAYVIDQCLQVPGLRVLVGRKTNKELNNTTRRVFFELCPTDFYRKEDFNKQENYMKFKRHKGKHSEVWFVNLEETLDNEQTLKKIQGYDLGLVAVDEMTEISEFMFLTLIGRLSQVDCDAPRKLIAACNPAGHMWIWKKWIKAGHEAKYHEIFVHPKDNPSLPKDYLEELANMPEPYRSRFFEGSWDCFEGLVWPMFDPRIHEIDPFQIPPEWPRFESIDHGQAAPTAVLWWAIDYDGNVYGYDEHYESGKLVSHHAQKIKEKREFSFYGGRNQIIINTVIDPHCQRQTMQKNNSPYSIIDEYADYGIFCSAGNNNREAGFNRVGEYMKVDPERIHPRTNEKGSPKFFLLRGTCPKLAEEIQGYMRKPSRPDGSIVESETIGSDHAVDSGRYFIMSRSEPAMIEGPKKSEIQLRLERLKAPVVEETWW